MKFDEFDKFKKVMMKNIQLENINTVNIVLFIFMILAFTAHVVTRNYLVYKLLINNTTYKNFRMSFIIEFILNVIIIMSSIGFDIGSKKYLKLE